MLSDARPGQTVAPGRVKREDYEYVREGVCNLLLWCEPLRGRRHVIVTERWTKVDWAHAIEDVVDVHYPNAERVVLVLDYLNTHTPGSLYEAFSPAGAKRLADKWEIRDTPKHGSWLNMAEVELSTMTGPCLNRRIPDQETPGREVAAWDAARNALGGTVNWRFTTEEARVKPKRLYPSLDG